jgi:hypothetical protein
MNRHRIVSLPNVLCSARGTRGAQQVAASSWFRMHHLHRLLAYLNAIDGLRARAELHSRASKSG